MQQYFGMNYNDALASQVDYIVNDPRKTTQEINDLLENIKHDLEMPPENREGTPLELKYPLYEHQKIALTWLKAMEAGSNKGGILADDMGLGKTISSLALIVSNKSTNARCKVRTLIFIQTNYNVLIEARPPSLLVLSHWFDSGSVSSTRRSRPDIN